MSSWFVLPLLSPRAEGVPGVFAALSIRKRGSEISVGISESEQLLKNKLRSSNHTPTELIKGR